MTTYHIADSLKNRKYSKSATGQAFIGLSGRPSKKQTRLYCDNEYLDKGYAASFPRNVTAVYVVLLRHANYKTQKCFPSIDTLMRLSGIKNRNSIIKSLKILESYRIIAISHGKGRAPNHYLMLDTKYWLPAKSISIDTITSKSMKAVSIPSNLEYQKQVNNSISTDTRNHIKKSKNEISGKERIIKTSKIMFKDYYLEADIDLVITQIEAAKLALTMSAVKSALAKLSAQGKITPIKPFNW